MPRSDGCHDGRMDAVNLDAMLGRIDEHWSPKKIAQVNDYDVRIVKLQGEFTWHRHADTDAGWPAVQRHRPVAAGDHRPRQRRQGPDRPDRPPGRPEPGPVPAGPLPARPGLAAPAVARSRQPGAADRRRHLPDDRPPRPAMRTQPVPAPVPASLQPHLAGPRRPRGRPDGTQRLDLPADAPPLRRQRPQRPRPPHLRPHHDRHLTPAATTPALARGRRPCQRARGSPSLSRSARTKARADQLPANHAGLKRESVPGSRSPKSVNDQLRELPSLSACPTKIPQVRLPDRPHRHPTDTAAFRSTPRHSC